jgi:hypothetical protein
MGGETMADTNSESERTLPPVYLLTTVDNPFDPFTQWDEWYAWDMSAGYNTPGLLARVALTSDEISDADYILAIQAAMDEIVRENISGMHMMVQRGELTTTTAPADEG